MILAYYITVQWLFTYLNKFTDLNTFKIEVSHRCSDDGGLTLLLWTVLILQIIHQKLPSQTLLLYICYCKLLGVDSFGRLLWNAICNKNKLIF